MEPKPRTKTPQELIKLIDENYEDIMKDVGFRFTPSEESPFDAMILNQLNDRPVLQHVLYTHFKHGARFANSPDLFYRVQKLGEVKWPEQIAPALLSSAIGCPNFEGNPKLAEPYLNVGRTL